MAYAVSIALSGVDKFTGVAQQVNKSLKGTEKTARDVSRATDARPYEQNYRRMGEASRLYYFVQEKYLGAARHTVREFGRSITETADQLRGFTPALEGIIGIGSIAGIGKLVTGFASFAGSLTRTSATLDLPVKQTQEWSKAFERAGFGADAFGQSYRGVNKAALEARAYGAGPATGIAQLYGINLHASNLSVMKQVADLVKRLHDEGQNVETQSQVLRAFNIAEDQLPLWQRGGAAIQELHDQEERAGVVTDELVARGYKLEGSLIGLGQAAEKAGHTIAGDLQPTLQPVIDSFKTWLDELDKNPAAMKGIETGAEILAGVLGGPFLFRIAMLTARFTGLRAAIVGVAAALELPAAAVTGLGALLGGLGYLGAKGYNKSIENQGIMVDPLTGTITPVPGARPPPFKQEQHGMGTTGEWFGKTWLGRKLWGEPPAAAPGPQGALSGIGATQAQYDVFRSSIAGIESGGRYGIMGGSSNRFAGKYQMGAQEIAETAGRLGEPVPTRDQFLSDPAMQERFFANYTEDHDRWLMANSARYRNETVPEKLATLGYAHNQGAAGAARYLATGAPGSDAFGTSGTAYSSAISRNLAALPNEGGAPPVQLGAAPGAGQQTADTSGNDTSHTVEVRFVDAPQGLRTGITRADGDARLALRTQFALSAPF
jgi:hypothetical protein